MAGRYRRNRGILRRKRERRHTLNPLIFGLGNIFVPKAVLAFKERSTAGLRQAINRDLLLRAAPTGFVLLVDSFAGDELLYLLYGSEDYAGHGPVVIIVLLAGYISALVIGSPFYMALLVMEHPRGLPD